MRICACPSLGLGKANAAEQPGCVVLGPGSLIGPVEPYRFADPPADSVGRIEAGKRLLEDHRDLTAASRSDNHRAFRRSGWRRSGCKHPSYTPGPGLLLACTRRAATPSRWALRREGACGSPQKPPGRLRAVSSEALWQNPFRFRLQVFRGVSDSRKRSGARPRVSGTTGPAQVPGAAAGRRGRCFSCRLNPAHRRT